MDRTTARILNDLTSDFYRRVSSSFSETRQAPWEGWERVLEVVFHADGAQSAKSAQGARSQEAQPQNARLQGAQPLGTRNAHGTLRVLDLGCGNLRFERFLAERLGSFPETWAFDNCPALANAGLSDDARGHVRFQPLDVVNTLLEGEAERETATLAQALDMPPGAVDLAVAFGFMHHLALPTHRLAVLEALVARTRPGGHVAVAFWQFANSPKLRAKAETATARGCAALGLADDAGAPLLDENDYLLGWQHAEGVWRYCHHFTEREIDELSTALAPCAHEVARFSADGKTHDLNRYVVFERR
ncbi:MAG: hypothetical protein Q4C41_00735 [Eggerthellaceae bacterium]|nr:hypothetical protein [Eggerthellaceae bacterium]